MALIDKDELLRRALYHAKEAERLLEEAFQGHCRDTGRKPSEVNDEWIKRHSGGVSHPKCLACGRFHPIGMPCPHMMTMCGR